MLINKKNSIGFIVLFTFTLCNSIVHGQVTKNQLAGQQNVITTAVPFLTITPDSRSGAMGDAGVAISPDANSIHWNASKLAFVEKPIGFGISYAPWLRHIVPDVQLSYLSGFSRINQNSTVGGSFRYFSLGNINFTDITGNPMGSFEPNEFAIDGFYATKLSDKMSLAVTLRFIYSNLVGTRTGSGTSASPGIAGSGDVSWYYKDKLKKSKTPTEYAFGVAITNLGSKITYTNAQEADFIPMNLRLGTAWTFNIDEFNSFMATCDFNKLLVPTPNYRSPTNPDSIIGRDPRVPVLQGAFQSFFDAPGGFKEELNEITISLGAEYWYAKTFALRMGYFHEANTKGQRKYISFGMGLRYNVIGIDAAYLAPFQRSHPLQNQLRFSLLLDMEAFSKGANAKTSK
ncbi:MAG: type IX secretion system outer membrane channel protein PorV [Bacteroidia bacterium]|nr:type IX secretion system outer membrane channel protein PorV [Bacteroidia bacterium]